MVAWPLSACACARVGPYALPWARFEFRRAAGGGGHEKKTSSRCAAARPSPKSSQCPPNANRAAWPASDRQTHGGTHQTETNKKGERKGKTLVPEWLRMLGLVDDEFGPLCVIATGVVQSVWSTARSPTESQPRVSAVTHREQGGSRRELVSSSSSSSGTHIAPNTVQLCETDKCETQRSREGHANQRKPVGLHRRPLTRLSTSLRLLQSHNSALTHIHSNRRAFAQLTLLAPLLTAP